MAKFKLIKKGWTLVELIIVVLIISVISLGIPQLISQIYRFYRINTLNMELQQEARIIMELISKDLRHARSSTITIDSLSGQPYYSRISFVTIKGSSVTYYQEGRNLIRISGIHRKTLSKNLYYLAFAFPQSYDLSIVSVSFTLEKYLYQLQYKALHMASEKIRVMNE